MRKEESEERASCGRREREMEDEATHENLESGEESVGEDAEWMRHEGEQKICFCRRCFALPAGHAGVDTKGKTHRHR